MKVADSYKNYTFNENNAFDKNGKLYVTATCTCDRCGGNGIYASRVENGHIVPHPAYNGVCLQCGGTGIVTKEIRLYTDKEYDAMQRAKATREAKAKEEQEAKMHAEFAANKREWCSEHAISDEGMTYIYFPSDSYEQREALKADGFHFDRTLMWHANFIPAGYEEKVIALSFDTIGEFSAWGQGNYSTDAAKTVAKLIAEKQPVSASEWIGQEKEKISALPVTLVSIHSFETRYGYSQAVTFHNEDNVVTWFTATNIKFNEGDNLLLSGTIKKLDEYKGVKQTVMTRCRLQERD